MGVLGFVYAHFVVGLLSVTALDIAQDSWGLVPPVEKHFLAQVPLVILQASVVAGHGGLGPGGHVCACLGLSI